MRPKPPSLYSLRAQRPENIAIAYGGPCRKLEVRTYLSLVFDEADRSGTITDDSFILHCRVRLSASTNACGVGRERASRFGSPTNGDVDVLRRPAVRSPILTRALSKQRKRTARAYTHGRDASDGRPMTTLLRLPRLRCRATHGP